MVIVGIGSYAGLLAMRRNSDYADGTYVEPANMQSKDKFTSPKKTDLSIDNSVAKV